VWVDISALKEKERALEQQSRQLEAILTHVAQGVNILDPDMRIVAVNDGFMQFYGFPPELGRPGTHVAEFIRHRLARGERYEGEEEGAGGGDVEAMVARRIEALRRCRPGESTVHEETRPDGRVLEVRRTRLANGTLISTYTDVTERVRAEEALKESERRFRTIVDDQVEFISRFTPDFTITFVNNAYARQLGRPREEVIGGDLLDLMTPAQREQFRRQLAALTPERPTVSYTMETALLGGGGTGWEEWTDRALFDDAGRLVEYQSVGRDVTERRRAEEALKESERRFRAIVDDQIEFILRFTPDLSITFVNNAYVRQLGRPREDLIGGSALDLVTVEQRAWFTRQLAGLTPDRPTVSYELEVPLPGGGTGWEAWTDRALFDDAGRLIEYQSVGRDITEQRLAAERLQASERRFRAIAEAHPVPVVISCVDRAKFLFVSPPCVELLGMPLDELYRVDTTRFYADPGERARVIERIRREGTLDGYEARLRRGDGTVFWASFTSKLITFEGEEAMITALTDLTERKQAETEIARQRAALHQRDKMSALGSLLAGVAHELNNPLSVVVGQSLLLEETSADPKVKQRAAKVRQAADRCARIVKTFLAMVRQRAPERAPVDLNALVRDSLELVAYALRTGDVRVRRELAPDLPPLWGDADQLNQVVANLLANAQQALLERPGERELVVRTSADPDGRSLRLEVADNGPGVPEALRPRIFEPFFTTKPEGIGTGIGLSVCRNIVEAHGGRIALAGRPGGGAVFAVTLPIDAGPRRGVTDKAAPAAGAAAVRPLSVLVVDDEPDIARMLVDILRADGHEAAVAESGRAALERLAERDFDLILSDLRMPDLDGPGLYRELEASGRHPLGRIAFITGDTLGVGVSRFLAETAVPYLEKPFVPEDVRGLIARVVADRRAAAAG
ncbi:MAG TPA: PAS domain S-box protein, partial [Geminicoccaceae bacterium]|nr:PAS domain S-box protein [Geminicoccaceae bacterium]